MIRYLLFALLFLSSCSSKTVKNDTDFSSDMNIEEFKIKLEVYSKEKPYPKLDN